MSTQRIVGLILLIAGIALLVFGLRASDSVADQVSDTFTGKFTDSTMWYIIGGVGVGLAGLYLMIARGGKRLG